MDLVLCLTQPSHRPLVLGLDENLCEVDPIFKESLGSGKRSEQCETCVLALGAEEKGLLAAGAVSVVHL